MCEREKTMLKKINKKILCLVLSFSIIGISKVPFVFASEFNNIPSSIHISNRGDSITDAIYSSREHKLIEAAKLTDSSYSIRAVSNFLTIPRYKQTNNYYCGPASVQMIAKYVSGNSYSQSQLASYMNTTSGNGTVVYEMANGLRYYAHSQYAFSNLSSTALSNIRTSINSGYPVVYHVMTGSLRANYPFNSGHFIVGYGYSNLPVGGEYPSYYYYDPWYGNIIDDQALRSSYLQKAINDNAGYFIW